MERLRRRQQRQTAVSVLPDTTVEFPVEEEPVTDPAPIEVIWGPIAERIPAEGMTVAQARSLLEQPLNIPRTALALIDGHPARPTQRLASGNTLEFVRRAGEKGGGS